MKPTPMLVTADVVLLGKTNGEITDVLLIQRKNPPFQFQWALPGGFVDPDEDLPVAASRELAEETNVELSVLTQIGAYGNPNRDERGRVITVAFSAVIPKESAQPKAMDDAMNIDWFSLKNLPDLAFDHAQILADALAKMNSKIT